MSDCEICRWFRDEQGEGKKSYWYCDSPDVTLDQFAEQLLDDAEDCPAFYPGQTSIYTYSEGKWEHRCSRMPTDCQVLWDEQARAWYLWDGIADERQILCCPWCPLELRPMPKEIAHDEGGEE